MRSSSSLYSRVFLVLGAIVIIGFVFMGIGFAVVSLIGGSGASAAYAKIIPPSFMFSPTGGLPLPFVGLVLLFVSIGFKGNIYREAVGKVLTVHSVRSNDTGIVKFDGVRLRIKADSSISVGDSVKGKEVKIYSYDVNPGAMGAQGTAQARFLMVSKVSPDEAYDFNENDPASSGGR